MDKQWTKPASEPFEIQAILEPVTHQRRLLLVAPLLEDLPKAVKKLQKSGVPALANIYFKQWNSPPNNYYVIAVWEE